MQRVSSCGHPLHIRVQRYNFFYTYGIVPALISCCAVMHPAVYWSPESVFFRFLGWCMSIWSLRCEVST